MCCAGGWPSEASNSICRWEIGFFSSSFPFFFSFCTRLSRIFSSLPCAGVPEVVAPLWNGSFFNICVTDIAVQAATCIILMKALLQSVARQQAIHPFMAAIKWAEETKFIIIKQLRNTQKFAIKAVEGFRALISRPVLRHGITHAQTNSSTWSFFHWNFLSHL